MSQPATAHEAHHKRRVEWFDPRGHPVPGGAAVPPGRGRDAALDLEGAGEARTTLGRIQAESERLGLVSRRGTVAGTQLVLPLGVALEHSAERLAREQARRLGCEEVRLPGLFRADHQGIVDLTARFDRAGRTYRLVQDRRTSLAYAADPGLFQWLEGQRLDLHAGPRFVYSPLLVHKAFRSGEVSVLNQRQYLLPDVHAFCRADQRDEALAAFFRVASNGVRALVGQDWLVNLDVTSSLRERWPTLATDVTAWTGSHLRVVTGPDLIGYMAMRVAIGTSIGAGAVMLCNIQWDEVNGPRFGITDEDGTPVSVLHGTLLSGMAKVVPTVVGRGLAGLRPTRFPVGLAPTQLYVVPVARRHHGVARRVVHWADRAGLRARVLGADEGSVGRRIRAVRDDWGQYVAVVGDLEDHPRDVGIRRLPHRGQVPLAVFARAVARVSALGSSGGLR